MISSNNVIYKLYYKLTQIRFKNPIYKIHKGHWSIGQGKGQHFKFTMTISSLKCGFGDVSRLKFKLMISKPQNNIG